MPESSSSLPLEVSINYLTNILAPFLVAGGALYKLPWSWSVAGCGTAALAWGAYITVDTPQYTGEGRHDPHFSKTNKMFQQLRAYLRMTLHRTEEVQQQLVKKSATGVGQAIFAAFPHGVNGDFRMLMDGMMLEAFPSVAPARALAASVLFQIPGARSFALKTGCVDAGRATAKKVLSKKLSLVVLPGGLDEQVLCEHGKERVVVQKRHGFVRLAMEHGVPLVPVYVFGCSDLYYTSSFLMSLRMWLVKNLRVALPIYWGGWGLCYYPNPSGFPLPVPQNVVFGDPIEVPHTEKPTKEQVAAAHATFVAALIALFDQHKAQFNAADRTLEVL